MCGYCSGQANVTIPVVSTLKTSYTDTLTSEAVVASLDGKGLPSVVIDFTSFLAQTDKVNCPVDSMVSKLLGACELQMFRCFYISK